MARFEYRTDIDGLRAVAVVPVVLNHAGIPGFPGGFIGVDIFFVISGFLITGILAREIDERRFSVVRFYERRARRILPALFVVLACCLVGGWFLLSPLGYVALGKSTLATLLFSSNMWFWHGAGDYFGAGVEYEPLLHTWSLAVEEQFYLVFPLLLWVMAARSRSTWITVVAILSALSLLLSIWLTRAAPTANFYFAPPRAWELGAGALLALGSLRPSGKRWLHELAGAAGLVLIAGSIVLISSETPFPGLTAVPPVLGAVLIIFAGSGGGSMASALLSLRPMVWIGLISYSLYLWHWPILVAARIMTESSLLGLDVAAFCVLLSVALAWLSWRFVEHPFRVRSGAGAISATRIFGASALGATVLAAAALVVMRTGGFLGQFPEEQLQAYKAAIRRGPLEKSCMADPNGTVPCPIGLPADTTRPATVVVWGDSHAGALLVGFDAWLKDTGRSGMAFAKAACPPVLGVWRADLGGEHRCDTHNDQVLEWIESTPDIHQVILVGRWALAAEGTRPPGEAGGPAVLARSGEPSEGIGDNADLLAEGLARLVERLEARDIEVELLAGIPEIGRNVPEMVLRHGDSPALQPLLPQRSDYDARNLRANRIIDTLAANDGVTVLHPADVMCGVTCLVAVGDAPLYRDDDHMSVFGARWLVSRLFAGS